jgi:2,4-dienoyl-CoA reductase-like NADH-dependent reductase (Old Yellow Enzyme family)
MPGINDALFSRITVGGLSAPNRLAAQPMEINSAADGGRVSEPVMKRYTSLARGGWGVVFVEALAFSAESHARKRGLVLDGSTLDGFKRLAEKFKKEGGGGLLLFQLSHAGRLCHAEGARAKAYEDEDDIRLLEEPELNDVRDRFVESLRLAREAGADGVDIKACHGYLGGELLRPLNLRGDRYGGSVENRARLLSSVLAAGRAEFPGFIVGTRVSLYEGIRGGCGTASPDEAMEDLRGILEILACAVDAGAAYINVSAGIPTVTPHLTRPVRGNTFDMFHHFRYARIVKDRFPGVIVFGSAYSSARADAVRWAGENIEKGYADFAGFGRQSLADPLFPAKLREGSDDIRWCTLCGGCSGLLKGQKKVYCVQYDG